MSCCTCEDQCDIGDPSHCTEGDPVGLGPRLGTQLVEGRLETGQGRLVRGKKEKEQLNMEGKETWKGKKKGKGKG